MSYFRPKRLPAGAAGGFRIPREIACDSSAKLLLTSQRNSSRWLSPRLERPLTTDEPAFWLRVERNFPTRETPLFLTVEQCVHLRAPLQVTGPCLSLKRIHPTPRWIATWAAIHTLSSRLPHPSPRHHYRGTALTNTGVPRT